MTWINEYRSSFDAVRSASLLYGRCFGYTCGSAAPPAGHARSQRPAAYYQLNTLQIYLERGLTETAMFELVFRKLPPERGFLLTPVEIGAGLHELAAACDRSRAR